MANDIQPAEQVPDFYLENQPGAPFRAELNTIIAALVSSNAGTTEPENPQAGWLWLDTSATPWTLFRRNADNTAWIKQYDTQNKPSKSEIGLGNVPNFTATSAITDDSDSKFATAKAISTLNNNKLEKGGTAADSARLGGVAAGSYALQSGSYSGLRAQATTKGDVGLGSVPNYGISDSTSSDSSTTFASSKAVYDLNQAKLGKSEQATDSGKLGGKAPSSYADKVHSHEAGDLPTGTTSAPGLVQMSDSTGSSSTTLAATANSVRKAKAEAIASGVPPGCIMMFAGTTGQIPAGWQLCNGSGETSNGIKVPNLRDRFIVGAGSGYDSGKTGGATSATSSSNGSHSHSVTVNSGGSHSHTITVNSHTLTKNEMPSHQHHEAAIINPDANGAGMYVYGASEGTESSQIYSRTTYPINSMHGNSSLEGSGGSHSHTASSNSTGSHTHTASSNSTGAHTHTVSTLPPYYALAYIIKL